MASAVGNAKICKTCGKDVSGARRFKDAQGRYLCGDCGEKEMDAEATRKSEASRSGGDSEPGMMDKFKAMPKWKQGLVLAGLVVLIGLVWWLQT